MMGVRKVVATVMDKAPGSVRRFMRRRGIPALFVFTLTATGLLLSLFLVWTTISSERAGRAQAARTGEIMKALGDIDRAAINAESGQRGYFITLDRRYLATYEFGRTLYPTALEKLNRELRGGDPLDRQNVLLRQIEDHADAKFAELAVSVDLIGQGRIMDAQQSILTDEGRVRMERLRAALTEMETLERAILSRATAEAMRDENRILPLLALTMFLTFGALALGLSQTVRATHAEAQAAQAVELEEARDRADLLAHELNHRVKNLFAVVLAIVRMSARDAPDSRPVTEGIAARIHALLVAHDATQGKDPDGNASMRRLIDKVLAPYLTDDNPVEVTGPDVTLTTREATPLGLVFHELATNAVKYGAWSENGGRIRIGWNLKGAGDDRKLAIEWREFSDNPTAPAEREGFGSMLMQSSARQLGGKIERTFASDGLVVAMDIPHPE